jgi:rRNA maturation endonuclease Nob1
MEALLEKRAYEEEYSVEKCLDTADAMEELTDEEKAIAAEVFENDMNMQMFMKQKNLNVRLIWLRRKIRYAYLHCLPSILKINLNVHLILLFGTCSRLASF